MFTSRVMTYKMSEMANFFHFLLIIAKKLVTVWAISLSISGRSHRIFSEMVCLIGFGHNCSRDTVGRNIKQIKVLSQEWTSEIM